MTNSNNTKTPNIEVPSSEAPGAEMLKKRSLQNGPVPQHIAITMDGNGRWAKKRGLPRTEGHKRGAEVTKEIIDACDAIGVKFLSLYAFSYENWQRPPAEVAFLLSELLPYAIKKNMKRIEETALRVHIMGEIELLPPKTLEIVRDVVTRTRRNHGMVVNFAISYSGRLEILQAVGKLLNEIEQGEIRKEDITENVFSEHLYTAGFPDPEFHIRCGGVNRISNFMLWQMAYTELLAPGTLWPDFTPAALYETILYYQNQPRKFGRVPKEDQ